MRNISKHDKEKLTKILEELIEVIVQMRKESNSFLLSQNEREAREWMAYLKTHDDVDEIYSLKKEIVERFVNRFDVQICETALDNERAGLMKLFIYAVRDILKDRCST